jgi:hypothetical protein
VGTTPLRERTTAGIPVGLQRGHHAADAGGRIAQPFRRRGQTAGLDGAKQSPAFFSIHTKPSFDAKSKTFVKRSSLSSKIQRTAALVKSIMRPAGAAAICAISPLHKRRVLV